MGPHPGLARPGEWLRQQRVAAGLTQEDLAERSGVSVRAIADLERGRTRKPYPSSVRALVAALGLPEAAGDALVARYRAGEGDDARPAAGSDGVRLAGPDRAAGGDRGGNKTSGGIADELGAVTVPRQLPTRVPHFAGRSEELALLDEVLDEAASARASGATGVVISAIGGTAGVGKTALALHWAHRVAHRFPDGQLYANLRGFDAAPHGRPAEPTAGRRAARLPRRARGAPGAAAGRRRGAGGAVPLGAGRAADAGAARQRGRCRAGQAAAAGLAGVPGDRHQQAGAGGAVRARGRAAAPARRAERDRGERAAGRPAGPAAGGGRAVGGNRAGHAVRAAAAGAVGGGGPGRRRAQPAAVGPRGRADRARRPAGRA